jgi:hypothetical protein
MYALRVVPELQMPFMTVVGKADALVKVGRVSEAEEFVTTTLAEAPRIVSVAERTA